MAEEAANNLIHCSFCGKSQKEVKKLIAGPGDAFICDECVILSFQILLNENVPIPARVVEEVQKLVPDELESEFFTSNKPLTPEQLAGPLAVARMVPP